MVDNDTVGPARETVTRLQEELCLNITYGIEPKDMISGSRNHVLRLAQGNYIGIIDDEFSPQHWLITIFRAIHTFVDVWVLSIHIFKQQPPVCLLKGGFCNRPVHRSFDSKCKTSGSDKDFFREAMQVGCRFIAVEEAPVYEIVPPERQTKSYYTEARYC